MSGAFGTRRPRRSFTPYKPIKPRPEPQPQPQPSPITAAVAPPPAPAQAPALARAVPKSVPSTPVDPSDRQILTPKSVARPFHFRYRTPNSSATANHGNHVGASVDYASQVAMANDSAASPTTPSPIQLAAQYYSDNLAPIVNPAFRVAANGLTHGIKRAAEVTSK